MSRIYDVIVIGSGPAGAGAGINAARHGLGTLMLAESFQGESRTAKIENWLGEPVISSKSLAQKLEAHIKSFPLSLKIKMPEKVHTIRKNNHLYELITSKASYQSKAIIVATGVSHRKLNVAGEAELSDKGINYCTNCDAPFYTGKNVALVADAGHRDDAFKTLSKYAKNVYRVEPLGIVQITGNNWVTGIMYLDQKTKQQQTLSVDGVFVELGWQPNSNAVKDLVQLDEFRFIITNRETGATSEPGIFAAGDVTNGRYKQYNIAAGDGVKAALGVRDYLSHTTR